MQADVEKRFMGTGVEPDVDTAAFMRILELRQGLKDRLPGGGRAPPRLY